MRTGSTSTVPLTLYLPPGIAGYHAPVNAVAVAKSIGPRDRDSRQGWLNYTVTALTA